MAHPRQRTLVFLTFAFLVIGGGGWYWLWTTTMDYKVARLLDQIRDYETAPMTVRIQWALGDGGDSPATLEKKLAALDSSAIPALIRAIDDPNHDVRVSAIKGLEFRRDRRVVRALLEACNDKAVGAAADSVLGKVIKDCGPEIADELIMAMKSPHWETRNAATRALGYSGDPRAEEFILGMLHDPEERIRYTSLMFLGDAQSPHSLSALVDALVGDPNVMVRWGVTQELGHRHAIIAVPALIDTLRDPDLNLQRTAAWALGEIGQPEALDQLTVAAQSTDENLRDIANDAICKIKEAQATSRPSAP